MTTLYSVCNGPESEEAKFESNDAMGFANEEYPDIKGDALTQTTNQIWLGRIDRSCFELSTWVGETK